MFIEKTFSCKCGNRIKGGPPDDIRTEAHSVMKKDSKDEPYVMEIPCRQCDYVNKIYWYTPSSK